MTLTRRRLLMLTSAAVTLPALPRVAIAHGYPSRAVRWIVPFPPGGLADIVVRLIGQYLSERLGQPFVVENRPGASTNIGTEAVVRAPADGHTLLFVGQPNAINASLFPKLSFNFIRDIAPIAGIMRVPNVVLINPKVPARTLPEFIAYAKANPGKLNFASSGTGTTSHMAAELFKMSAGVDVVHVPYRGSGPALNDLLAGQIDVMFDNLTSSIEHIASGKLRALAVTTAQRSSLLSDVPAVSDVLPGFDVSAWSGVGTSRATPPHIVELLNRHINDSLADPRIKARIADLGGSLIAGTPAAFATLIADETEKWGKVVRGANIAVR